MSRLIDEEKVIASLEELQPKLDLLASMCVREVIELIEEQPTAYDIEKVDNQILEYFKGVIDKKIDGWDIVDISKDIREIIRKGGVE